MGKSISPTEKGRAIRRCREDGKDPYENNAWERYTDVALAQAKWGKVEAPKPDPNAPRTFSSDKREPWLDRDLKTIDRQKKDNERRCKESMRPGIGRRDWSRI